MPTATPARSVTAASPTRAGATVASPAVLAGVTLFTAAHTTLIIRPAPAGHGIVFRRTDLPDQPRIPALITHLVPESRHTVLSANPRDRAAAVVHTTEHLLSALAAMGVTDALLDLHGPEVPIGDGSAALFTDALAASRVCPLPGTPGDAAAAPIRVRERIEVTDSSGASVEILPPESGNGAGGPSLELEYRLDYGASAPIPAQRATFHLVHGGGEGGAYRREIAPARTFCLLEEAQAMQKMGLFRHLKPQDMLVIGENGRPIDNELRFADEPARHKLLDLLGDLALAGRPIIGRVIASRSGHALNHEVARRLLAHAAS